MERAIILPFSVNASGSILSSSDQKEIFQSRVVSAVMTEIGERVFRPTYGGTVKTALFESEADASSIVSNSIKDVFNKYLGNLSLLNVLTSIDQQQGILSVTIDYALPNKDKAQVSFKTGTLDRTGKVIQEY
jgi:phage baseplate assembly protein W